MTRGVATRGLGDEGGWSGGVGWPVRVVSGDGDEVLLCLETWLRRLPRAWRNRGDGWLTLATLSYSWHNRNDVSNAVHLLTIYPPVVAEVLSDFAKYSETTPPGSVS